MEKFKTKKEFEEFANDKLMFEKDSAIKLFYQNDYGVYNDSVECIYSCQEPYYDYAYYYDAKKDIIIVSSYYVGD